MENDIDSAYSFSLPNFRDLESMFLLTKQYKN